MQANSLHDDYVVRVTELGDVRIEEIRASAGRSRRLACGAEPASRLVFVFRGSIGTEPSRSAPRWGAPGWGVDSGRHPLHVAAGTQALVLTLPDLPQALAHPVGHASCHGVARILLDLARSTVDVAAQLNESARAEIGNSLAELARLALRDDAAQQPRLSGRTIMCERVKTFVRRHLHQNNLSIDYIARSLHCTKRYLHKAFDDGACSLNEFIWSQRLERCAQDLANVQYGGRSVTEIAFSWGFSNSSHFSRAFRQRFGMPPSAYRAAATG